MDNAAEFVNEDLRNFLANLGIHHKKSTAHVPQQNGYVERDVRTVIESACSMLNSSVLPKQLWAEAINTAVYVLNRSINENSTITPFQLWFNKKPEVGNLHIFG